MPILFVVYPDILLLDLAGPLQVFEGARHPKDGRPAYQTAIASVTGGFIPTDTPVVIATEALESWLERERHTLVIVGGNGAQQAMHDRVLLQHIQSMSRNAKRVCSVCSGALVLAAAGLLARRRATTHWSDCAQLASQFPQTIVEIDPIYIQDGDIWTSAGITADIDMALAMVQQDLGVSPALELAKSLLTYMVRPGGQSQFSHALQRQMQDHSERFGALHKWIEAHLTQDLCTEALANEMHMSTRNFHRVYSATMQMTPARAVQLIRVDKAKQMLEGSDKSIKQIAALCGFGDDEWMRRAFVRHAGVSPSEYRDRFSA